MHKIEFESCGRSMRWYEWFAGLLLLGMAVGARAEAVFKCVDAQGGISYQDVGCAAQQQQTTMAIAPTLRNSPPPQYAVEHPRSAEHTRERPVAHNAHAPRERVAKETAYECRAGDGRVFYRLAGCPHSIVGEASASSASVHRGKGVAHGSSGSASVAARRIPRDEACHEIHRAGAIGRDGHEFDEHVSTYERNLGHDPCKS